MKVLAHFSSLAMASRTTAVVILGMICLALVACDSPQRTIEQLSDEITNYPVSPTPAAESAISAGFAKLDAEISRLQTKGRSNDAAILQQTRNQLQAEYDAAKVSATIKKTTDTVKQFGENVRQAGEEIGDIFRGSSSPTPQPTPDY
jgi:hypothetical protein